MASRARVSFARSAALPRAIDQGSWIISMEPTLMITSSPAMAITDAAEAAMPSTRTVTFALWARSTLAMATPSLATPPGELRWSTSSSTSRPATSFTKSAAVTPK
jgi:hypothetical protein